VATWNRRGFLESSIGGLAALALGSRAYGVVERLASSAPQPPHESLILSWQRDPTTTMTIQWLGAPADAGATTVHYMPVVGTAWHSAKTIARPFPGTDLQVFRCELTSLSPGADYTFHIGGHRQEYAFRTMPAKATDEICFVSGGDCGIAEHAMTSNLHAAAQDPQFVLLGGDLAYDNGKTPDVFHQFLKNYSSTMVDSRGRLIPLVSCMGNHEVSTSTNAKRKHAASYLPLFDGLYTDTTYGVLDIGDYMSLVLLDSGHVSPADGEQTSWLETTLKERQDRPHLLVANHVPCYPSVRNPYREDKEAGTGEVQRRHWCPLFEKYGVDVVLEHHDHAFKRTHPLIDGLHDKNGVVYLGDGSWGKIRAPRPPEERPYLAKVSEAYHISVHRLQGDERFHVALEESGKIADVSMTKGKRISRRG